MHPSVGRGGASVLKLIGHYIHLSSKAYRVFGNKQLIVGNRLTLRKDPNKIGVHLTMHSRNYYINVCKKGAWSVLREFARKGARSLPIGR